MSPPVKSEDPARAVYIYTSKNQAPVVSSLWTAALTTSKANVSEGVYRCVVASRPQKKHETLTTSQISHFFGKPSGESAPAHTRLVSAPGIVAAKAVRDDGAGNVAIVLELAQTDLLRAILRGNRTPAQLLQ